MWRGIIETPIHENGVRRGSKIFHFVLSLLISSLVDLPGESLFEFAFYHLLSHLSTLVPPIVSVAPDSCTRFIDFSTVDRYNIYIVL